jgi:hypothetical protein
MLLQRRYVELGGKLVPDMDILVHEQCSRRRFAFRTKTATKEVLVIDSLVMAFFLDLGDPSTEGVHHSEGTVKGLKEEIIEVFLGLLNNNSKINSVL